MSQKLKEVDQEFQRGCMNIFLIRYVLTAWGSRPGAPKRIYEYIPDQNSLFDMSWNLTEIDQELKGGYMSIFRIRYVLKAWGNRPGAPRRICEYVPY